MLKLTELHPGVKITVSYDESWMWFSWHTDFEWGKVTGESYFDDAYYGKWRECHKCLSRTDSDNDDDRADPEHTICYDCGSEEEHKSLPTKEPAWLEEPTS